MITEDQTLQTIFNKYAHMGVVVLHTNLNEINYIIKDGVMDEKTRIAFDENTICRIASVSKIEVALCAMKLYEEGRLDIYTDISKYLGYKVRNPYFPNDPITIEMLMTQTSSIHDGEENKGLGYDGINGPLVDVSLERLLTDPTYIYYTDKTWGTKKPGTDWLYSNFGCGILACIVEKVSGKYFAQYVKEVLLDPLEIDGGYRIDQVKNQNKVASLYEYNQGFTLERDLDGFLTHCYPYYPIGNNFRMVAGGLFISASDLSKIMLMLMNNGTYKNKQLFKKETILEMKKTHWEGESPDPQYHKKGLQQIKLDGYSKETLIGHFGYAYGLRSFLLYNKDNGYIFICNGANYGGYADHMTNMQDEIIHYLVNKFEG